MNKVAEELKGLLGSKLNLFESKVDVGSSAMTLLAKSPASELGLLSVQVTEDEIIIRLRGFHKHLNAGATESGEAASAAMLAMNLIKEIFDGKYYFFEIHDGKNVLSSGGGPERLNGDEKKLLESMFGARVSIREWNWFGTF